MAKKKSIAKLVEDAARELQLLVRLKAADDNGYVSCVTCGETRHYKDGMQGGHFIERKWLATKLMEENIHPQCSTCNGGFGGKPKGNLRAYTLYMEDMYGREFIDELETLKHQSRKYYRAEVEEMIKDFREQIREHKERVGG